MGSNIRDSVELISLHSISKGIIGECGLRGGYFETHNIDKYASEQIYKLKSIELCSNTIGQVTTALMVDPPKRGLESNKTVEKFEQETNHIFQGLKLRAQLLTKSLNDMTNVTCSEI